MVSEAGCSSCFLLLFCFLCISANIRTRQERSSVSLVCRILFFYFFFLQIQSKFLNLKLGRRFCSKPSKLVLVSQHKGDNPISEDSFSPLCDQSHMSQSGATDPVLPCLPGPPPGRPCPQIQPSSPPLLGKQVTPKYSLDF